MNEKEKHSDSERLASLEKENEELRKQLKALGDNENKEADSYRLFFEARKKFLTWISIPLVILGAFGIVSWAKMVDDIREHAKNLVAEQIVKQHLPEILSEATNVVLERLIPMIQAEAQILMDKEIRATLAEATSAAMPEQKQSLEVIQQAFEKSYEEELYFVVAGSSPDPKDLDGELERVKGEIGSGFGRLFPNVEIYPPNKGFQNSALVIGQAQPLPMAEELKERAVNKGFRRDTYIWRKSRAFFDYKP